MSTKQNQKSPNLSWKKSLIYLINFNSLISLTSPENLSFDAHINKNADAINCGLKMGQMIQKAMDAVNKP